MYKVTIFQSAKTKSKTPISPYGDNTFIFDTYDVSNNIGMFSVMVSNFILNIPLSKLKKPVRTFRRKSSLEEYYDDELNYVILDIDDVNTEFNKHEVLEYFKDYKVILGESKSYNGIDNFNMKGILFIEPTKINDIKSLITFLNADIGDICIIDESVARRGTLNAPIRKNKIFINNEDGLLYKFVVPDVNNEKIKSLKMEYLSTISDEVDITKIKEITSLTIDQVDSIERLCLKIFHTMGFEAVKNNPNDSISFKHPSERKTKGGYFWFNSAPYTMHHANSLKSINIFESVKKLDIGKQLLKKDIDYSDEFLKFNTNTDVLTVNHKFLNITEDVSKKIDKFLHERNGLMSIRSPMGTGKSTIIKHIIDECHNTELKVLIVTNRISVAQDFSKKYGVKLYNSDLYEIGDSLVCQYDSLWKFNIKFFDIVIMDEFISIMLHSRSNLSNGSMNIAKFFGCFNKKLVIADAFLTGYESFLLDNKDHNIHMIDNIYRDETKLYDYDNFNYFVDTILHTSKNHKITVSSTSLSFINSLQYILKKRGKNTVSLTADTPDTTKELIYKVFDESNHNKWDILLYSPTLTVGVSNLNDVDYHFHYDSSMSTDVISSIQMMKRTRKTKEIHMFIKEKMNFLKTSYNDIRDEYMGNIGKNLDQNYLFEIDNYGESRLSSIGKKAIKIDTFRNILEFDHKKALTWLLQYHFKNTPINVSDSYNYNVLTKYQKIVKNNKNELKRSKIEEFLLLNDMEKSMILMDWEADKTLISLSEIYECFDMSDMSFEEKEELLQDCIDNPSIIEKTKKYKILSDFNSGNLSVNDIKRIISNLIIEGQTDSLRFYNLIIENKDIELQDKYLPKNIISNKNLKSILDNCGYVYTKSNIIGTRLYQINPMVKKYARKIK